MQVQKSIFGKTEQGEEVIKYTIINQHGISVSLLNYGASVCSILTPDKHSKTEEITICYDNFKDLSTKSPYYGSTIGRVANRISNGEFSIGIVDYKVATNNGHNHLHGGLKAFDKAIWDTHIKTYAEKVAIEFRYFSPNGEEGYPGNLDTTVTYILNNQNQLIIHYVAVTDAMTPVNLTNHTYWNLSGNAKENILNHTLQLHDCDHFLVNNDHHVPTGVILATKNSSFDFSEPRTIGSRIAQTNGGYDNCYVFSKGNLEKELKRCATIIDSNSGRRLDIATTYGGAQLYSGNMMNGDKAPHTMNYGLCIECQYWPDAINQRRFPPIILDPGATYHHTTVHTFSVEK